MKEEKILVRKMKFEDLKEVYEIERKSYISPWHISIFQNEIKNPSSNYIVLNLDKKIIGYGGMNCIMQESHITNLTVHPEFRRKGFGEILLLCLIYDTISLGARWVTLEVRISNTPAIMLYKKYNFREAGIRPGYYLDTKEDAIIMWSEDLFKKEVREKFINLYNKLNIIREK
jgi:ribosomal-protein-alanine N-acetyltransferase